MNINLRESGKVRRTVRCRGGIASGGSRGFGFVPPLTPALSPLRGEGARTAICDYSTIVAADEPPRNLISWPTNAALGVRTSSALVAAPSPLNGERAGVRGENATRPSPFPKAPPIVLSHEPHHPRAFAPAIHAGGTAPVLANSPGPAIRRLQVSPRASDGALRPGFLLRGSKALARIGWRSARLSRSNTAGRSEGKLSSVARHPHQAILEFAGAARTGNGQGELVASLAGTVAASRQRSNGGVSEIPATAFGRAMQEGAAPAESFASESGVRGRLASLGNSERSGIISPLTPALSPLRGEGARTALSDYSIALAAYGGPRISIAWQESAAIRIRISIVPAATPSPLIGERAGVRGVNVAEHPLHPNPPLFTASVHSSAARFSTRSI